MPGVVCSWDDVHDVWQSFIAREHVYQPRPYMRRHPEQRPLMRAKIINWIIEVDGCCSSLMYC